MRLEGELGLAHAADLDRELLRAEATDARRLSLVRPPVIVNRVFVLCGVENILPFGD